MADIEKPLSGVTVVELGHSVAAPYAGLILADLGARD
jgi:crotonobetainyl-CoA:carnitine CoA-transferase CaiB-like acyl-CoA transferase